MSPVRHFETCLYQKNIDVDAVEFKNNSTSDLLIPHITWYKSEGV